MNLSKQCILLLMVIGLLSSGCSEKTPLPVENPQVVAVTGIPYISGDTSVRHQLDVYHLSTQKQAKVVMFVPGGAWRQGDKATYETLATTLCNRKGYTVAVINYRLSDSTQGNAVHPDHIRDVAAAFSWLTRNIGQYGGDPNRIFLFGQSAGAHLVSLLVSDTGYLEAVGCSVSMVQGVISMSAPYTLKNLVTMPANPWGLTPADVLMYRVMIQQAFGSYDTSVINPASPSMHLHGSMPPFLIIHTELDMPGFQAEGDDFYQKMLTVPTVPVNIQVLRQSDYSAETWAAATEMAAAEPAVSAYIGHYAEVVAINEVDFQDVPSSWITAFLDQW